MLSDARVCHRTIQYGTINQCSKAHPANYIASQYKTKVQEHSLLHLPPCVLDFHTPKFTPTLHKQNRVPCIRLHVI